nr:hypothetical protein [uncultured bacterium]
MDIEHIRQAGSAYFEDLSKRVNAAGAEHQDRLQERLRAAAPRIDVSRYIPVNCEFQRAIEEVNKRQRERFEEMRSTVSIVSMEAIRREAGF